MNPEASHLALRHYSERLRGHDGPECTASRCQAPGRMKSTGWLQRDQVLGWCAEYECSIHGTLLAYVKDIEPIVNEIVAGLPTS